MICEMCGQETPTVNNVKVEGAILGLCPACAKFGTAVDPGFETPSGTPAQGAQTAATRLATRDKRMEERDLFQELPPLELDPDWPHKIRTSRERLGLSQEAFGSLLNEKSSVVHKLEGGAFHPPDAMVRKIERLLKIRLRAPPETS